MASPFAQIFATMISDGFTGITRRCSMVPCSRSRISAAPVRRTDRMVTLLMTCITALNQLESRFGLNMARTTRLIGSAAASSLPLRNFAVSAWMIDCRNTVPLPAWAMAVASTLSWISDLRPARRSASNSGGKRSTKTKAPLSMLASIRSAEISTGVSNSGGRMALTMRPDRAERSSST